MKRKDRPESIADAETNREMCRVWYDRNKEQHKERMRKWREENPDYMAKWREENREWKNAKTKLRRLCRPDKLKREKMEEYWEGLDGSDIEFDDDIAEICEQVYRRMLKELRKIYNRDPETGRKLSEDNN